LRERLLRRSVAVFVPADGFRGGKVAMALALSDQPDHADRLARLVSVDMAPNRGKISDEFAS